MSPTPRRRPTRRKSKPKHSRKSFGKLVRRSFALLLVIVVGLFIASVCGYLDFGKDAPIDPAEMVTAHGETSDYRRALAHSPYADLKATAQPGTRHRISQWASDLVSTDEREEQESPADPWQTPQPREVDPARIFLANGCDVDRLAATVRPILREAGFDVCGVDNADRFNYFETLIVDRGSRPGEAEAVCALLRERWQVGRVLLQVRRSPEADVLVILGRDLAEVLMPDKAQAGR